MELSGTRCLESITLEDIATLLPFREDADFCPLRSYLAEVRNSLPFAIAGSSSLIVDAGLRHRLSTLPGMPR